MILIVTRVTRELSTDIIWYVWVYKDLAFLMDNRLSPGYHADINFVYSWENRTIRELKRSQYMRFHYQFMAIKRRVFKLALTFGGGRIHFDVR